MRSFFRQFSTLVFTSFILFSTSLRAQDNARFWPIVVNNHLSQPVRYIARFSDWYTLGDILQIQSTRRSSSKNNGSYNSGRIAAKARLDHIFNIWFMSYPKSRATSMQVVQFYLSPKKSLCKVAIITQTVGYKSRILLVIANHLNCQARWSKKWYYTQSKTKQKTKPILIKLQRVQLN